MNKIDRQDLFQVRDFLPADKNFIMATFLRGLYYGDSWFSQIPKAIFMENMHRVIEAVFYKPGLSIKVACLKDDPDVILGYSISRELSNPNISILDYVFVKSAWRNIGIGKKLVPNKAAAYTHATRIGQAIVKEKMSYMIYNPFLFNI